MLLNRENIMLFKKAHRVYNKSNMDLEKDLKAFEFYCDMDLKWRGEGFAASFKDNFFSLLMVSLLLKGSESGNVMGYTKIISCVRQIITCADNIIDREDKGVMFLRGMKNRVVKNTLLSMVSQNILEKTSRELCGDDRISKAVINKIHRIAAAESRRDEEQYITYPLPEYVKEAIHRGIGGELLEVSMTAPRVIEGTSRVESYSEGLFKIGMGLQALDDLCDIDEDLKAGKVNYAVAKLISGGNTLKELKERSEVKPEEGFTAAYVAEVIEETLDGFGILTENGFPMSKGDLNLLLKHLFRIRGLESYWKQSA